METKSCGGYDGVFDNLVFTHAGHSSSIIQEIIQHCQQDPSLTIVYFYFDFKETDKQNPDKLLSSLASQLSVKSRKAQAFLQSLHACCQSGAQQPTIEALKKLREALRSLPKGLDNTYDRILLSIDKFQGSIHDSAMALFLCSTYATQRDCRSFGR